MSYREIIAEHVLKLFQTVGEPAAYTPAFGGASLPCHIVVDLNTDMQPAGVDAQVWQIATVVRACLAETGGTEPGRGSTFETVDSTYTVQAVVGNDGFEVKLAVT